MSIIMCEKNLLVISNKYPNQKITFTGDIFVKEQLNYLKEYFDNIYVISPVAYGLERLRSIRYFKGGMLKNLNNTISHDNYEYENIKVFFPKYFNFPLFYYFGRSIWLDYETQSIMTLIEREKLKFDLIHAHFTWPCGAVAIKLKQMFGVPVVITEHDTFKTICNKFYKKDFFYIDTWMNSDAIIRVSKNDIPFLVNSSGVNKNKIHHIVNGYDPKKYLKITKREARSKLNLPIDQIIILNIARLNIVKGQKHLIEAFSTIKDKLNDCAVYIGGSGPEMVQLSKLICDYGLQKSCFLLGFIPEEQISLWMNACDIFVLPSLDETNPTVMFEALGCGKPFVGTKVGAIPEIIVSDEYGLLVEPANSVDLADKILLALDRDWNYEKILTYAEQYSWKNIAREIMEVYTSVVE